MEKLYISKATKSVLVRTIIVFPVFLNGYSSYPAKCSALKGNANILEGRKRTKYSVVKLETLTNNCDIGANPVVVCHIICSELCKGNHH